MLEIGWWWALLLLPLPWLARRLLPAAADVQQGLLVPLLVDHEIPKPGFTLGRSWTQILVCLIWLGLVAAAARPLWIGDPIARTVSGRDMMLAVDVSGSMRESDMMVASQVVTRLQVLKSTLGDFIDRRRGDRLGLILFGTRAYLYVPLTFDLETLNQLLQDVSLGLAGRRTAIGDAIGMAVKSLRDQSSRHQILILATDGNNTAGIGDPVDAARAAAFHGITIYTIGIGSDAASLRRRLNLEQLPPGSALDEDLLKQVSSITGGEYFRATDAISLERIYAHLDRLEPIERMDQIHRPRTELFPWPLSLALLALALLTLRIFLEGRRSIRRAVTEP